MLVLDFNLGYTFLKYENLISVVTVSGAQMISDYIILYFLCVSCYIKLLHEIFLSVFINFNFKKLLTLVFCGSCYKIYILERKLKKLFLILYQILNFFYKK